MKQPAWFAARCLAGFFLLTGSAFACDGVAESCPATSQSAVEYRYTSTNGRVEPQTGQWIPSSASAVSAGCSAFQPYENDANCIYSAVTCPVDLVVPVKSGSTFPAGSFKAQYTVTQVAGKYCGIASGTPKNVIYSLAGRDGTQIVCNNPLYPVGPDASNLCYKSGCQAGNRWNSYLNEATGESQYFTGAEGTTSMCYGFDGPNGTVDKCKVKPSAGGICTVDSCLFDYVTQTGERCDAEQEQGNASDDGDPCTTYVDGHKACDSDPAPDTENSAPGNNGSGSRCISSGGKQYCVDVTPPEDNCAENPTDPVCNAPVPVNCAFVGGKYYCAEEANNCGTFNGVSLCICEDGTVQEPGGTCSNIPEGSGPGESGDGAGGGSEGEGAGVGQKIDDEFPTLTKPSKIEGLDEFQGKLGEKPESNLDGTSTGFEPFGFASGGCSSLSIPNPLGGTYQIQPPCDWMEVLRGFFGVMFVVFTIARCRNRILEAI